MDKQSKKDILATAAGTMAGSASGTWAGNLLQEGLKTQELTETTENDTPTNDDDSIEIPVTEPVDIEESDPVEVIEVVEVEPVEDPEPDDPEPIDDPEPDDVDPMDDPYIMMYGGPTFDPPIDDIFPINDDDIIDPNIWEEESGDPNDISDDVNDNLDTGNFDYPTQDDTIIL